jgi:formamidopyrimidine-DNA glycosylase
MPELPEVERAARWLRARTEGRTLLGVRVLHPALGRRLGRDAGARLRGRRIVGVERRGKHQFVRLDDGSVLHAHFRMTGDWVGGAPEDPLPRHARLVLDLDDGWVALVDPRALATVSLIAPGAEPAVTLGPDATDPALDAAALGRRLSGRRLAIKPALLDQSVLAGVGNIYAAEGLWRARIDPRVPAARLGPRRLARLLEGVRAALAAGTGGGRYAEGGGRGGETLHVYGREGEACERCGHRIRRIVQAGRSTYYCPGCQRP